MKQTLAIRGKLKQRKHIKDMVSELKKDLLEAERLIDIYEKTIKTLDFELQDWDNFNKLKNQFYNAVAQKNNFIY